MLLLGDMQHEGQPVMLTEFGGIACCGDMAGTWGYSRAETAEDLAREYEALFQVIHSLPTLAGFCYTQFADTYQEANGLLHADRTPKFDLDRMATATAGPHAQRERHAEWAWRERIMHTQRHQYLVPSEDHRMREDR